MRRRAAIRRRAEGYAEYALILSLMMVCSISALLTAGSESMRSVARSRQLCTMEKGGSRECDNLIRRDPNDPSKPAVDPSKPPADPSKPTVDPAKPGSDPSKPGSDPANPSGDPAADPKDPSAPTDPNAPPDLPPLDQPPASETPAYSHWFFGPEGPDSTTDYMLLSIFGLIGSLF